MIREHKSRRAGFVAAAVIGLAVMTPAFAQAAPAAPASPQPAPPATAAAPSTGSPLDAREARPNARSGVWTQLYNRSGKATFSVQDRNSGKVWKVGPKQTVAFDSDFTTVADDIELKVTPDSNPDHWFDIDISNPTIGYPNVSVNGTNKRFSEWETKWYSAGETRVEVQRHDDQNNRKRFYINITPPGPIASPDASQQR